MISDISHLPSHHLPQVNSTESGQFCWRNPENLPVVINNEVNVSVMVHIVPVSIVIQVNIWLPQIALFQMNLFETAVVTGIPGKVVVVPLKPHPGIELENRLPRIKI